MKMVKSLLLGSAAGLFAVAGAQAADLPVKAKPVEYVKICSAYGAGFYYIPGTDVCLRVGGYVWSDFYYNDNGAAPNDASGSIGSAFQNNRGIDRDSFRTRFDMVFDARTNTEYGTLRSYASVGWQWTTNPAGLRDTQIPAAAGNYAWYYDRAFIQFAGLTFGYVGSFFDFDPSLILNQTHSKSFAFTPAIAYTAQFGNGVSASVSVEDATTRRTAITTFGNLPGSNGIVNGAVFGYNAPSGGTCVTSNGLNNAACVATGTSGWGTFLYGGQEMPDIVANLRVDQAWGDAQISGAAHQLITTVNPGIANGPAGLGVPGTTLAATKMGYAALAGVNIKLPMLGAGDSFQVEGAWAHGAEDYTGVSANPYQVNYGAGYRGSLRGPVFVWNDSFVDGTGQHLTTAYSANAMYRHFWTPTIRSTFMYGYNKIKEPVEAQVAGPAAGVGGCAQINGCGNFPGGTIQQVTANLIWSPVPKLDLGLEGYWEQLKTDCGGLSAANCALDPQRGQSASFFGGLVRARRDF